MPTKYHAISVCSGQQNDTPRATTFLGLGHTKQLIVLQGKVNKMVVLSYSVTQTMQSNDDFSKHVARSILRFSRKDWGDVSDTDKQTNDEAVEAHTQVLGAYGNGKDKVWIIKDAFDGPVTVMYPSDY